MYDLARGPLLWLAIAVFVIGMGYRVIRLNSLIRLRENEGGKKDQNKNLPQSAPSSEEIALNRILKFKDSVLYRHPVMTIATSIFHLCLIISPLFALGHSLLFYQSWGITPPHLPDSVIDFMTLVVIIGSVFFLVRRIMIPRVRAISSVTDFLLLAITAAPFLTGFFAYHQWGDYRAVILLHMLVGELMLIAIPFTKLGHMIYFFFIRFLIRSEHNWGSGKRAWIE